MDHYKALIKRWRKVACGRLYLRRNWRKGYTRRFDSDDVALIINGTERMHLKSIGALEELIAYYERIERIDESLGGD
jgi:hypothetical protein